MAWLLLLPLDRLLVFLSLPSLIIGIIKSSWNLTSSDMKTVSCAGGCNVDDRIYPYYIADPTSVCTPAQPGGTLPNLPPAGTAYECLTNKMHSAPMWLGLGGLAIMTILMARNVKAAIIIGISITTIIAWLPGHGASYLGHTSNIPGECILHPLLQFTSEHSSSETSC